MRIVPGENMNNLNNKILSSFILLFLLVSFFETQAQSKNGFDLKGALIPINEILSGGPPKDGIPSINTPKFVPVSGAKFMKKKDRILGIYRNGIAKAYPIKIMNWHEIVNDHFNDEAIVVTYCPLCGSGVAYKATIKNVKRTFGVSGLLYNSDVLLFDRQSESLWSQIKNQAVSGSLKGEKLTPVILEHTSWENWKKQYENTLVLSTETGYQRDYSRDPYIGYEKKKETYFPINNKDERFHPKETVLGLEIDGKFKAYPFSELKKVKGAIRDNFNQQNNQIEFDKKHKSASIKNERGKKIPSVTLFWFAWIAFHPDSEVFIEKKYKKDGY
jgi:hypothetical protein